MAEKDAGVHARNQPIAEQVSLGQAASYVQGKVPFARESSQVQERLPVKVGLMLSYGKINNKMFETQSLNLVIIVIYCCLGQAGFYP